MPDRAVGCELLADLRVIALYLFDGVYCRFVRDLFVAEYSISLANLIGVACDKR